jgi:hypothetical protein
MDIQEKKKIGFFDQIIYSVQPKKYGELLRQPKRAVVGYVLLLAVLFTIMEYVIPAAGWMASFGGVDNLITKVLPKIEFSQGELTAESKIEIGKESTVHILVDTSVDQMKTSNLDTDKYLSEVLIGKNNMILYSNYAGAAQLDFAQYQNYSFDNQSLLALKPWIYAGLVLSFFTTFFTELISYLVSALPLALIEWIVGRPGRTNRLSFKKIYLLTLYAKTVVELILDFISTSGWIDNTELLVYFGLFVSMFLLMTGVRKTEESVK